MKLKSTDKFFTLKDRKFIISNNVVEDTKTVQNLSKKL